MPLPFLVFSSMLLDRLLNEFYHNSPKPNMRNCSQICKLPLLHSNLGSTFPRPNHRLHQNTLVNLTARSPLSCLDEPEHLPSKD
jgi:hypothetical protein